jgi:hypothetical protein
MNCCECINAAAKKLREHALIKSTPVKVDKDVLGLDWKVSDFQELAKLIAVVAVGQAAHAARILDQLVPNAPALSIPILNKSACDQLTIKGKTQEQKTAAVAHRDGFLFECIAWIATRQGANDRTVQKDPHTSATSQGLDGLVVELHAKKEEVKAVTICEDKCTAYPRSKFQSEVMKTFAEHHEGSKRSRELISTAVDLIKANFPDETKATQAAAKVMDLRYRFYRAALTVDATVVTAEKRAKLFKDYDSLSGIAQAQRIGATFVVKGDLRTWFQQLADAVIGEIKSGKVKNV